jgi:diadenylate cyclase
MKENDMDSVLSVLEGIFRYLRLIRINDVLDVAIIAFAVYKLIPLIKRTRAGNLIWGVVMFVVALGLSYALKLQGVSYILSHILEIGVLALVILFQPELRQLLESVGSRNIKLLQILSPEHVKTGLEQAISQTVVACTELSRNRTGVLIVFERKYMLDDMVRSGTVLDAAVSSELLKNIFFVKAPMHDGAVIIRNGRVLAAGCMLPLSKNVNLSRDLGMRHRAGIGMSENSDAVVVIVSEETGSISVALGGMLKRHLMPETLEQLLRNELMPPEEEGTDKSRFVLKDLLRLRKKEEQDGEE